MASTPPWFISLIVHFSIMIFLGLLVLGRERGEQEEDGSRSICRTPTRKTTKSMPRQLGEQLTDPTQKFSTEGWSRRRIRSRRLRRHDLPQVKDPLVGPPVMDPTPNGTYAGGHDTDAVDRAGASGREEGHEEGALKAYGGTALTEDSVKLGLSWLVRQQRSRGIVELTGPYKSGANIENEEAATAMALIAFQGAGIHDIEQQDDPYTRVVTRGWKELLRRREQDDGHFFANLTSGATSTLHAGDVHDRDLRAVWHDARRIVSAPAQKAVDYCVKIQSPEGGWRYQPGVDADLSVTGWFAMAMQSAADGRPRGAEPGVRADRPNSWTRWPARRWLTLRLSIQAGATKPLTAEGLLCRQYLGWAHDDGRAANGVDYILANLPGLERSQRVLLVLRHAGLPSHGRQGLAKMERSDAANSAGEPGEAGRRTRQLGPDGDRWGEPAGGST